MDFFSCGYEITEDRAGVIAPIDVIRAWHKMQSDMILGDNALKAQIDILGLILESHKTGHKEFFVPARYLIWMINEFAVNKSILFDRGKSEYRTAFVTSIERFMLEYKPVYWKGFLYSIAFMN